MARVAAAQLAAGTDVDANLEACLRMIDAAAEREADLVVLPEFCNHLSWYTDRAHAHRMACTLDGPFLAAIAARAAQHRMYVKIGVTVARSGGRTTGASLLYGRDGTLLGEADKQVLMGAENDHLDRGDGEFPVIDTDLGRIGLYACMEGVISEVCRGLALRGAQILLNSLNSFAVDEASLHVPVRAAENKVWVVAANKIGPLLPVEHLPAIVERLKVPAEYLNGAGESQIVAPDGTTLAIAPREGEAVVVADIDPRVADDKRRPDGTDILRARRPGLYRPLSTRPRGRTAPAGAATLPVALAQPDLAAVGEAVAAGAQLVLLPELAGPSAAELAEALHGTSAHVVCTERRGDAHVGLLVGADGIVGVQPQLHASAAYPWLTELGDELHVFALPWGRMSIAVGDDALFPETFRLAVTADADLVAAPFTPRENWDLRLGLAERAAENRLNVLAAGRDEQGGLTGAVYALSPDFTLWTAWQGPFTGVISHPIVTTVPPEASVLVTDVRPAQAVNRDVSRGTNLVDGRPDTPTLTRQQEQV